MVHLAELRLHGHDDVFDSLAELSSILKVEGTVTVSEDLLTSQKNEIFCTAAEGYIIIALSKIGSGIARVACRTDVMIGD